MTTTESTVSYFERHRRLFGYRWWLSDKYPGVTSMNPISIGSFLDLTELGARAFSYMVARVIDIHEEDYIDVDT